MSDRREARAWLIHEAHEAGVPTRKLAEFFEVSVRTVQLAISRCEWQLGLCIQNRVLVRPPGLVPFFPIAPYTPTSTCRHATIPIPQGTVLTCGICWRSGLDGHPALQRDPRTDPKPDPKPKPGAKPAGARETRKERRRKLRSSVTSSGPSASPGTSPSGSLR